MSFTNAKIVGQNVNPVDYFRIPEGTERGHATWPMSSSSLRAFGSCPSRWLAGYNPPDSEAKEFGRLMDCMVLTPDQFVARYAIQPAEYESDEGKKKWSNNAHVCKAWCNKRRGEGKEIVTMSDVAEARKAHDRLRADDVLNAFIAASDCQVWLEAEWKDEATGIEVPCRCLIDCVPRLETEFAKAMGDLKTTKNAALMVWQRWAFSAGYHVQAAFDMDMYLAAKPTEDRVSWCWLVQENFAPWETARRLCSQDFLTLGRATYRNLLSNYCQCLKAGRYPSYDDHDESAQGWSIVEPESWMAEREAFAPHFNFEQQDQQDETEYGPS